LSKINSGPVESGSAQDTTNPYPSVKNLPVLGVQWVDLYRNTKIHETVFELLTQQYELAKIQEAREIPTVKVLDSASLPEKRYPQPSLIIFLGLIMGGVLGCLFIWVKDVWSGWNAQDPRRRLLERTYGGIIGKLRLKHKSEFSAGNGNPGQQDEDVEREYSNRRA
jgi:hypothetical protein